MQISETSKTFKCSYFKHHDHLSSKKIQVHLKNKSFSLFSKTKLKLSTKLKILIPQKRLKIHLIFCQLTQKATFFWENKKITP